MLMFRGLDLWLIDKIFDPLADWLFGVFKVGNYTLSKWCLMLGSGLLVTAIAYFTIMAKGLGILGVITMFIELLFAMAAMRLAFRLEEQYQNHGAARLPPNLRDGEASPVWMRRFFLFLTILVVPTKLIEIPLIGWKHVWEVHLMDGHGFQYAGWIPILVGLYFLACIPRLPRENFSPALSPVEA